MNAEKLKKLQAQTKATGKGQPRRKVVKKPKGAASAPGDDKKLQGALKKLGVINMQGVEEVNMFKDEGSKILHFSAPKVHGAANANTFAVYGSPQEKDLTELVPGILPQLGADSIANLRRLATSLGGLPDGGAGGHGSKEADDDDDDDVPDLVENFDVEETKDSKFESVD